MGAGGGSWLGRGLLLSGGVVSSGAGVAVGRTLALGVVPAMRGRELVTGVGVWQASSERVRPTRAQRMAAWGLVMA
jgi:hypothetical protein